MLQTAPLLAHPARCRSRLPIPPARVTAQRSCRGRPAPCATALTTRYVEVSVDTSSVSLQRGVGLADITPLVRDAVAATGVRNGLCTVTSKHTTTAVVVNENEERLFSDVQAFLLRLAPPEPQSQYKHNDIHLRCAHAARASPAARPGARGARAC